MGVGRGETQRWRDRERRREKSRNLVHEGLAVLLKNCLGGSVQPAVSFKQAVNTCALINKC